MRTRPARLFPGALFLALLAASPAHAQWTPVPDVPTGKVFTVRSQGDTILAGVDSAVYVSTNAGLSFTRSAKPAVGIPAIDAVWMRNGRLYAGTFGKGVFVSDNLGTTWTAFNEGLTGGLFNSHLFITDFEVLADTLYAGTDGAGVYARTLAPGGTWHHFGEEFEPNQASGIVDLALGGTRLLAAAGANGMVFRRDPGDADWTVSFLNNVGLAPGLQAQDVTWTGSNFVVGVVSGVLKSPTGQEPWTPKAMGLGAIQNTAFVKTDPRLIGAFSIVNGAVIEASPDDGTTWEVLEGLPGVFVFKLATNHGIVYAARGDGLWRRTNPNVSVPDASAAGLRFLVEGAQPVMQSARLTFELPAAGDVEIAAYDVRGRVVGERIRESMSAGPHAVALGLRDVASGVYAVQLTAGGRRAVLRIVHLR